MVEVDPLILVAGAAAIAVLGVASCARSSSKGEKVDKNEKKGEKKGKKAATPPATTTSVDDQEDDEKTENIAPREEPPQKVTTKSEKKGKKTDGNTAGNIVNSTPVQTKGKADTPVPSAKNTSTPVAAPVAAPAVKSTPAAAAPAPVPAKASSAAKTTPIPEPAVAAPPAVTAAAATATATVAAAESGDKKKKAKETPEQKAARLERQKKRKEESDDATSTSFPVYSDREYLTSPPISEAWEVVEDKRKQKTKKGPATSSSETTTLTSASGTAADSSTPNAPEHINSKLTVDPKKIGIIIGPKGATLRSIQDLTAATINMPKADRETNAKSACISIVGSTDAVQNATDIIIELCTKGYSTRLEGENFQESHLSIHNQFLSDIIGKNGASIRALQDKLSVRITIPPNAGKDNNPMVKIGIAGDRENIHRAKEVIREIMTYYHSPITHPGHVHVALDIPPRMYNSIIGTKGGEIRHIQNNFKVAVHIPNPNSLTQHVIIVGENSNQVDNAVRYIQKIVQQITTDEAKTATVVDTWNEQTDLLSAATDETEPEWVSQYMYNREASKQVNLMAAVNVPISLSTAETNAWKMGDAAEGW